MCDTVKSLRQIESGITNGAVSFIFSENKSQILWNQLLKFNSNQDAMWLGLLKIELANTLYLL